MLLNDFARTSASNVATKSIAIGYWNSGIGLGSPWTVPEIIPDCSVGSLGSWKLMFEVTCFSVTLTPVLVWGW